MRCSKVLEALTPQKSKLERSIPQLFQAFERFTQAVRESFEKFRLVCCEEESERL